MEHIDIRWMKKEEVKEVAAMIWSCLGTGVLDQEFIDTYFEEGRHRSLIAVIDHEVIGHIWIDTVVNIFKTEIYFVLRHVCVKKEFKHLGIGSLLLKHCEEIAIEEGVKEITLNSSYYLAPAAHEFYKKNGYETKEMAVFYKNLETVSSKDEVCILKK